MLRASSSSFFAIGSVSAHVSLDGRTKNRASVVAFSPLVETFCILWLERARPPEAEDTIGTHPIGSGGCQRNWRRWRQHRLARCGRQPQNRAAFRGCRRGAGMLRPWRLFFDSIPSGRASHPGTPAALFILLTCSNGRDVTTPDAVGADSCRRELPALSS